MTERLIFDCDLHNDWSDANVLKPYLEPVWRDYLERGERPGHNKGFPAGHRPWLHPEDFRRSDIRPQTDDEHYTYMKEHHLDKYNITMGLLNGEEAIEASTLANPHYATALTNAYNRWMIETWLPRDDRFVASLVVAPQDPQGAAKEIRRIGDHPRIVQVLMSHGSTLPYGNPHYWPIWEAAHEMGLPVAIHLGGQGGLNHTPVGGGPPTYFWEAHAMLAQPAITHVASTIAHGIFEKFPNMKFIVTECGVAWVPPILWRLDADYKALRKETPWLRRLPSEYFREHIRFTTQPLERPANKEHLHSILDAMHAKETLMFASDYPHWDYDNVDQLPLPEDIKHQVLWENATKTYPRINELLAV